MASCKIFQVYYNEDTKNNLYDHVCIEPVFNPCPDTFSFHNLYYILENKIILDKIPDKVKEDYVGVWSHKHWEKIWNYSHDQTFRKDQGKDAFINWFASQCDKGDFDVYGFHRHLNKYHQKHMLTMAERFHKNYLSLLRRLISKAGCSEHVNLKPDFPFVTLMNYQVARTDIYLEYIEQVLKPVINAMLDQEDKTLQSFLFSDASYKGDAMKEGTLLRIGGKPYYTMHTFILERLFTLWLNTKNYKCVNY